MCKAVPVEEKPVEEEKAPEAEKPKKPKEEPKKEPKAEVPVVEQKPEPVSIEPGETIRLTCKVSGEIHWNLYIFLHISSD